MSHTQPSDVHQHQKSSTSHLEPSPHHHRILPGILRLLPETLPFYPYSQSTGDPLRLLKKRGRKQEQEDAESTDHSNGITNRPLQSISGDNDSSTYTLFFFVDSTNRQSLLAIPKVSQWFHYALDDGEDEYNNHQSENRVICIPNHASPNEINLSNSTSDPIMQATINSSLSSSVSKQQMSMLLNTGFYHLPFLHPKRVPLLNLLGANRVPSIIVVSNRTGRVITRYGWEAIERECTKLEEYIGSKWNESKKDTHEDTTTFESHVVNYWSEGKSGLPLWWSLLSWIM